MNHGTSRFDPRQLRRTVLQMAFSGGTVHIGCAFSLIEIMAVLYRGHLLAIRATIRMLRAEIISC